MTIHISARLAWHDSGWNGKICKNPKANTYCVGPYSFPGDMISTQRKVTVEEEHAGAEIGNLDYIPPCIWSCNAFGEKNLQTFNPPPSWFNDGTKIKEWPLPPYTICTWPYEEMYKDEVRNIPQRAGATRYDATARRESAIDYFSQLTPEKSLSFCYVNYSNPFSENDEHRYAIVGVSRIKSVGSEITWDKQSKKMEERYGPNVWARNITFDYPDQGLRIPYQQYLDDPGVLDRILFIPENSRNFKYATRHISDDGALGLIEQLSEIVGVLQEIDDTSENWEIRQSWLASIMAELWSNRGLYPGILRIWDYLKFKEAIPYTMEQTPQQNEDQLKDSLFSFLNADIDTLPGLVIPGSRLKKLRKKWKYLEKTQQELLQDVLPRFDLTTRQIEKIIEKPENASIYAEQSEIIESPYILSEEYVGEGSDDQITFSQIDHGMLPSPDLGEGPDMEPDDWQRLRALCIEQLKRVSQHTFMSAEQILFGLNNKLSFMPDWKRTQFTLKHLEVEKDDLSHALTYRLENDKLFLYRKAIFEDERLIENTLRQMAAQNDIILKSPVTENHWKNYLKKSESELAKEHPAEYEKAISNQVEVCAKIFRRPLSILCGAAGTGKTTIVEAIIKAIVKAHGASSSFQLLAPTGKAADRLRERTGKVASTIHSFLAKRGWLNDNFTFRRAGGQSEENVTTYIIDESSMIDLSMLATFFRSVNWNAVQRLIFVGDPNQLPPIGTGKIFSDLLDWLNVELPEHVGELTTNIRQIHNRITGKGTGILDLADIYLHRRLADEKSADLDVQEEEILSKIQEGGDVSGDLRVLFWDNPEILEKTLIDTIISDMEQDTGQSIDPKRPDMLWDTYFSIFEGEAQPERSQVISPYRGELYGIEHLNKTLQNTKNAWMTDNKGSLGGITFRDKVIQVCNRPHSNPIKAYNLSTKKNEGVEVFNGEIGYTKVHGFDHKKWKWSGFHLSQFQVVFSRKQHLWVAYNSESQVEENLELAYAISVHKSQGSEFQRVYFVLPKHKRGLLSRELFYTGLTRAQSHCTLLIEEDMAPIYSLRRRENSHLIKINSSLFNFTPVPEEFQNMFEWYEEGKIHRTLADYMVRSKSEVIIANMLFDRDIPFQYEMPLQAPDGTTVLPDFTTNWHGENWYWEHEGMLHNEDYRRRQEEKHAWYKKHGFADRLIVTKEGTGFDSQAVQKVIKDRFGI